MSIYNVLDTNVLLRDPYAINKFRDCIVVIPSSVIGEVDTFKKDNELGQNARLFSNYMDELYENNYYIEDINVEVKTYISNDDFVDKIYNDGATNDNRIIGLARELQNEGKQVVLYSEDTLVRIKARNLGIEASKFTSEESGSNNDMIYPGYTEMYLDADLISYLYKNKFISLKYIEEIKPVPHMFFIFKNGSQSVIGKVDKECQVIELLDNVKDLEVSGIRPRNVQQRMALELLLDKDIPLVTLIGKAGSGKTILTLASGLAMDNYNKTLLTKPDIPFGKDIGALPGGLEEKLGPLMRSYYDNLEILFGNNDSQNLDNIFEQLNIEINPLNSIRGRSQPNQFIILDEAQNLNKKEIKTIVTRVGEGAKIVVMGDPSQIDNPRLDPINNGLIYLINKFKGQKLHGHITLQKGERSDLASIAADIL